MKIDANNVEDIIGLSFMQEAMLYDYIVNDGQDQYFEQIHIKLKGEVSLTLFKKAWQYVMDCNAALRTIFRWEGLKSPIQIILKENEVAITYHDFAEPRDNFKNDVIEQIKYEELKKGFDLENVPFRITLLREEYNLFHMIINNHHILYDGWSNGILLNEFLKAYIYLSGNKVLEAVHKTSYKEFIKLIRNRDITENFWKEYLNGYKLKPVAKRKTGNINGNCNVGAYGSKICVQIADKLNSVVKEKEVTIASIFYTAWGICLQKYSYSEDVLIGTVVSGRNLHIKEVDRIIGLFINTIPLRIKLQSRDTVEVLLSRINRDLEARSDFEQTPLSEIKKYVLCNPNEDIFNSIMVIENYPVDMELLLKNNTLQVIEFDNNKMKTNFDITIEIRLFEEYEVCIKYKQEIFEKNEIEKMMRDFLKTLEDLADNTECYIESLIYSNNESENFTSTIDFDFE